MESTKDLVSSPIPDTDSSEPMEVDIKTEEENNSDSPKAKEEKPPCTNSTASDSLQSSHPPSGSTSSASTDIKEEKDLKKTHIKGEKRDDEGATKGSTNDVNMDVDLTKLKTKTEKMKTSQAGMSSRPSSTPPSDTGMWKTECKVDTPHQNDFILTDILITQWNKYP